MKVLLSLLFIVFAIFCNGQIHPHSPLNKEIKLKNDSVVTIADFKILQNKLTNLEFELKKIETKRNLAASYYQSASQSFSMMWLCYGFGTIVSAIGIGNLDGGIYTVGVCFNLVGVVYWISYMHKMHKMHKTMLYS
ncbi:MAG: hypothetical protein JXR58_04905 [Bacteroidales bacterium]|nr:hypothetical protein [Bacteroidales bacterium]